MRITYKICPLRPYPGEIYLFKDLGMLRAKYTSMTKKPYDFEDEATGGRFIHVKGNKRKNDVYLIYARKPHVLAHELTHVLLKTWEAIGAHPADGFGEPFCYMLSQLMLDAA